MNQPMGNEGSMSRGGNGIAKRQRWWYSRQMFGCKKKVLVEPCVDFYTLAKAICFLERLFLLMGDKIPLTRVSLRLLPLLLSARCAELLWHPPLTKPSLPQRDTILCLNLLMLSACDHAIYEAKQPNWLPRRESIHVFRTRPWSEATNPVCESEYLKSPHTIRCIGHQISSETAACYSACISFSTVVSRLKRHKRLLHKCAWPYVSLSFFIRIEDIARRPMDDIDT
ncbi:hypothetical protein V8B55DRAFT_1077628 [Mucor lusitanicus]